MCITNLRFTLYIKSHWTCDLVEDGKGCIRKEGSVSHSVLSLCKTMDWAHQALLSTGFSRQGYWNRWPYISPGDLPDPGIEPGCPALQAYTLLSKPPGNLKLCIILTTCIII